jgi:hypothetical protein
MLALMFVAAISCPSHFERVSHHQIDFAPGSSQIEGHQLQRLAAAVSSVVGDPMAEVRFQAYFEYAEPDARQPTIQLAQSRLDALRKASERLGVHDHLIGTRSSAIGLNVEGVHFQRAPFDAKRLDRVVLTVKVKSVCHPLADLADRLNPYE